MARQALDDWQDRVYELECAIEDVERDLTPSSTKAELREALDWVLAAARDVVAARL